MWGVLFVVPDIMAGGWVGGNTKSEVGGMARLRSCQTCGRIHAGACPQNKTRKKEATELTKLRTCRRWDQVRREVYGRDHYLCRVCWESGRLAVDCLEAHHIIPLSEYPDLAYDPDNIITLCIKHHKAADRGEIDRCMLHRLASEARISPPGGRGGGRGTPGYHESPHKRKKF